MKQGLQAHSKVEQPGLSSTKGYFKGFTLAEVLITLGIIGVVAALTMPTLLSNYQKQQTGVRAKHAYSMLSQAIKLSEVENGDFAGWQRDFTGAVSAANTKMVVDTYIAPYFKGMKNCNEGLENKCGVPVSAVGQNYILNSGVALSFTEMGWDYIPVLVDTNGPQKPNRIGRDVFYFFITNKGVKPFGWTEDLTREDAINGITYNDGGNYACKASQSEGQTWRYNDAHRYMCTALLMMDGWVMTDDYPW